MKPRRSASVLVFVTALAVGCGENRSGEAKPVAFVAGRVITKGQLEAAVENRREEAKREGEAAELGDPDSRQTRRRLLVLLVYWAELENGAARLGIHVTEEQVDARLDHLEEETEHDAFARSRERAQLLYAAIYRQVTRGVRVSSSEVDRYLRAARTAPRQRAAVRARLLVAKRTAAMHRWVVANDKRLAPRIHYDPDFVPVG
jgi:hypothetical protein